MGQPEKPLITENGPDSTTTSKAVPTRDAIIFLPGLDVTEVGNSVDDTARRIANALDDEVSAKAQFLIEKGESEDFEQLRGGKGKTRRVSIARRNDPDSPTQPIIDIYSLDYREPLTEDLVEMRPLNLLLAVSWTLFTNAKKLLLPSRKGGKTAAEINQTRMAWLLYLTLFLYALIVLAAFLGTIHSIIPRPPTTPVSNAESAHRGEAKPPVSGEAASVEGSSEESSAGHTEDSAEDLRSRLESALSKNLRTVTRFFQGLVVVITALGLFFKTDLKAIIRKSGVETVAANRYLTIDTGKELIMSRFSALLNHIAEKNDVEYRNVYVVAYSFGSIATIDALFPHGKPPRIFEMVSVLITIGCPFDFIRTYWPDYFTERNSGESRPRWLNVFARADILSSDFKDCPAKGEAPNYTGIAFATREPELYPNKSLLFGSKKKLEEYGGLERLGLIGFRAHTKYWEKGTAGCYRMIVEELFAAKDKTDP